jgi:hypothetical protein
MTSHDPLCPFSEPVDYELPCLCSLIESVRADEREKQREQGAERKRIYVLLDRRANAAYEKYKATGEPYYEGAMDALGALENDMRGQDDGWTR